MEEVLFLGNGFNRVSEGAMSWRSVMKELASFVGKSDRITQYLNHKPFTLVFEEIYFRSARVRNIDELALKERTAKLINSILPNELHAEAVLSGVNNILTTNYDYNLEVSSRLEFGSSQTKETKYSVHRRKCADGVCVWHIHGEADYPRTLMLGHEHYSGYVDKLQDFVPPLSGGTPARKAKRVDGRRKRGEGQNWVELFLDSNVHVIGFSFDYTEIELWWLLSVKERHRLGKRPVGTTTYYPVGPQPSQRVRAKEAILESFGVQIDSRFRLPDYREGYSAFLENFRRVTQ